MFVTKELAFKTKKSFDIRDLTDDVEQFLDGHKCKNGLVNVFTRHTTAMVKINEGEEGFRQDVQTWCEKYVSINEVYKHNDLEHRDPKTMCENKEECLNGHSHLRDMLFGVTSETIPVKDGKMLLGVRQRILFFEMDHARDRKVILSFT
jgi:secondary thiamine-phosphate synthase enzyme